MRSRGCCLWCRSLKEHRPLLEQSSAWQPNEKSFPTRHVTVPMFSTEVRLVLGRPAPLWGLAAPAAPSSLEFGSCLSSSFSPGKPRGEAGRHAL